MTPRAFCEEGVCEQTKGLVHAALGLISLVCFTYNVAALCYRREPHLVGNTILYGVVTGLETRKAINHFTT